MTESEGFQDLGASCIKNCTTIPSEAEKAHETDVANVHILARFLIW